MKISPFRFLPSLLLLASAPLTSAVTLLANPFVVPGGTGSEANTALSSTVPGWSVYSGSQGAVHTANSRVFITDRPFRDHPANTYGVLVMDGTGGSGGDPKFTVTTGLSIDSNAEGLTFSWLQGNSAFEPDLHVAVQIGGQWYGNSTPYKALIQTITEFASTDSLTATAQTFVFDPAASNWNIIDFIPSTSDPADGTLSWGGTSFSDLNGEITGVGFFTPNSSQGTIRIADFNITAVPEPTVATLTLPALLGLCIRRRRK